MLGAKHEVDVLVEIDDRRGVGHRHVAGSLAARAVEVLVPGIERNGEQGAGLPLEGDAAAGIVPHRGRAAAVEHQDHFLEQLALRRQFLPRRDLAHIAIVRGSRCFVVDEDALAAPPRPRPQLDGVKARHIVRADDVETFGPHPACIGGLLLGRELLRQFL